MMVNEMVDKMVNCETDLSPSHNLTISSSNRSDICLLSHLSQDEIIEKKECYHDPGERDEMRV